MTILAIIADIVAGVVRVGMNAYSTAQLDEAKALAALDAALAGSRLRVSAVLAQLDEARRVADARIAEGAAGKPDGEGA